MLNIKNNAFPLKRGEELRTAAIGKQDLVPKTICQSCCYLTSIKNLQPKKKLIKLPKVPFLCQSLHWSCIASANKFVWESCSKTSHPHRYFRACHGHRLIPLKLLVHISLFTSPKSITNLVWGFFKLQQHTEREHTLEESTSPTLLAWGQALLILKITLLSTFGIIIINGLAQMATFNSWITNSLCTQNTKQ